MADEIRELTEQERKEQIEYHLAELKKLRAVPRSDWHAGFEGAASPKANFYAATDLPPNECEGAFPI